MMTSTLDGRPYAGNPHAIKEQENLLFGVWEDRIGGSNFIRDGVIDETRFLKEKLKFVFVLKEANDL